MTKSKKTPPGKNMMAGPKLFVWPSFPDDTRGSTLKQLVNAFERAQFFKPLCPLKKEARGKKRRRKKNDDNVVKEQANESPVAKEEKRSDVAAPNASSGTIVTPPNPDQKPSSWSTHRKFLTIGINQSTRALEKDTISLLVIDESCTPASLTDHLRFLTALRFVPIIRIPGLRESLAPVVKINSVSALGFSKDLPKNDEFGMLVNNLLVRAKKVKIPWTYRELSGQSKSAVSGVNHNQAEIKTEEAMEVESGGDDKSVLPQKTENPICYQSVLVKKITPNPEKKKKKKKKNKQKQ